MRSPTHHTREDIRLNRLANRRLPELIVERIIQFIAGNGLKAGARIPTEADLSQVLGVGRSSVREALGALEFLGVVSRSTEGTFVRATGPDLLIAPLRYISSLLPADIHEFFEFRRVLEAELAGLAAKRATREDLRKLRVLAGRMQSTYDHERYVQANVDFHIQVAQAARNQLLLALYLSVRHIVAGFQLDMLRANPRIDPKRIAQHRSILTAIERRDSQAARKAMVGHLASVAEELGGKRVRG